MLSGERLGVSRAWTEQGCISCSLIMGLKKNRLNTLYLEYLVRIGCAFHEKSKVRGRTDFHTDGLTHKLVETY